MSFLDELNSDIDGIFGTKFQERDGREVPEASDVQLGNDAVKLEATMLYADMDGSTKMVDGSKWQLSAQVYKAYLKTACKIIRSEGGTIVAFDGDRVMAVFIGDYKNTDAVRTALKINHIRKVINERMAKYWNTSFELQQCCGIDTSTVRAVRTGIRGSNDLVWVGSAANYAAKMTELRKDNYNTWISKAVYDKMTDSVKYSNGVNMWESRSWTAEGGRSIYRSSYYWNIK